MRTACQRHGDAQSWIHEISCILTEILKIEEEATVKHHKELILLLADEIACVNYQRQHPAGIKLSHPEVIHQEYCSGSQGKSASESPPEYGCHSCIVVRKRSIFIFQSESVLTFSEVIKSSCHRGVGSCRSAEQLVTSPEVLFMRKELNLIKVPAAFGDYLRTGPGCHQ